MTDFAAIDFETANEQPSSVCSVGVVIVRGGEIVDSFYSLIPAEPEYYQWFCMQVHGLCPDDTEDAPVFPKAWETIAPMIDGLPIVAMSVICPYRIVCPYFSAIWRISSVTPWRQSCGERTSTWGPCRRISCLKSKVEAR